MKRSEFEGIIPFQTVAENGSFRAAARILGVTPSAVSQSIKQLEQRVGVPLLTRTTRSIGLTQAGEVLLRRVRPAMTEISDAYESIRDFGKRPSGLLRINAPRIALPVIFEPLLAPFQEAYPEIEVEIFLDDGLADIVAEGFDAGIRLGHLVQSDMVARPLTPASRMAVVGSPGYLQKHGRPASPDELAQHRCINFRRPTRRTIYNWRFIEGESERHISVGGGVIVNDPNAKMHAARAGLGLAYEVEAVVHADINAGTLEKVLEDYLPEIPGFYIYFPSRAQVMLKLRVFIDFAREFFADPVEKA